MKEDDVATKLQITNNQAKQWLRRLVDEGVLEKQSRPVRYTVREITLFDNVAAAQMPESSTSHSPEIRETSPSGKES
ncbi:MAG TPA: hypothetical protein VGK81_08455, partial [Anaerolineae bacterium]